MAEGKRSENLTGVGVDSSERLPGVHIARAMRQAAACGEQDGCASGFDRVAWPARAVVTAGMPYGNKPLHFGHIGGVFVPADCFARFLRDRIGADNVLFVSGTDCFGSPIDEGYRTFVEQQGFTGSIADYVARNHDAQKRTLESYDVSLSVFEGSNIGRCGEVHKRTSERLITRLHENGYLQKRSTLQFFDAEAGTFLNGRQVVGRCPVQGCKSEHAYADECDLGHSFSPAELIAPRSSITGSTPEMRPVTNWYFDLPRFGGFLASHADALEADPTVRPLVASALREFLGSPVIYIKNDLRADYEQVAAQLPAHEVRAPEQGKQSFELVFPDSDARDAARETLAAHGVRLRTGKALVPFRITGNIAWGVAAPTLDGLEGLTVWCWPESLWAPISFSAAALAERGSSLSWQDFWCAEDAQVYQFIGQDNLYFYGVVQPALFEALRPEGLSLADEPARPLRQTKLVANHHLLYGKKKASSSGAVKPPTADDLLAHYTRDQLRAHFLALGLDQKSVGFKPKVFLATEAERADPRVADPVLKEGALLTNVFNRLARSVLYEAKNNFDCALPLGTPSEPARAAAHEVLASYDRLMARVELHSVMSLMDGYIRSANKRWADQIGAAERAGDACARRGALVDAAFELWVSCLLMHPIVPAGCEQIREFLDFPASSFFSWDHDFNSLNVLCRLDEVEAGRHAVKELPARFDFFKKRPAHVES